MSIFIEFKYSYDNTDKILYGLSLNVTHSPRTKNMQKNK